MQTVNGVRDSAEWGLLTISREEYAKLKEHNYAGEGTPLDPSAPGLWAMVNEPEYGTVLWTGVTFSD